MTFVAAESVIVQVVADPVQALPQFTNEDPVAGVAVRTKTVPFTNEPEQVGGHAIPAGLDVTVPLPPFDEAIVTVSVGFGAAEAGTADNDPATRLASTKRAARPVRRSMGRKSTPVGVPVEAPP